MFHHALFLASDSTSEAARFEVSSLPQQTLMELLFAKFGRPTDIRNPDGTFKDIHNWQRVNVGLNGDVLEITYGMTFLQGSLALEYVPSTVKVLNFAFCTLRGTINVAALANSVEIITLQNNRLHGSVAFDALPSSTKRLSLQSNFFSGHVDLWHLPTSIEIMNISENRFEGSLCFEQLPNSLDTLLVQKNQFLGSISLRNIHKELRMLNFSSNLLSGVLDMTKVPKDTVVEFIPNRFEKIMRER